MALIACAECGKEVSDKAAACPQCGAPVSTPSAVPAEEKSRQTNSGCLPAMGLLLIALLAWAIWPKSRAPGDGVDNLPGSTAPPPASASNAPAKGWSFAGQQGDMFFVTITDTNIGKAPYHQAVARLCAGKTHCFVNFWTDARVTPRRLPLTDEQVEAQVAGYRLNTNTNLSAWGWRCSLFPDTPRSQCF